MSDLPPLEEFRAYLTVLARAQVGPRLRRRMSISDVVQNTLLEAHKGEERFRGETSAQRGAWLREILARQIANADRHHRREKRDVERERSIEKSWMRLEHCLADGQSTPSAKIIREERMQRTIESLATLPEEEQEAILLRYCGELSVDDIANELEVDRSTVARRVRRGLTTLQERLTED
ncbi:MAG: sigma-70 family RNA polymerase sigma factor, partial [Planctomycetota bacterium]